MRRPLQEFLRLEAAGGLVLLAATVAALVWANVDYGSYEDLWGASATIEGAGLAVTENLQHAVNDGLMAIFFLVVGLEVKRELTVGELSGRQAALLPLFAAVGGMVVPALIFLGVTAGGTGANGWGIPMATDVAFALGALTALGARAPTALVAFLLGVAVIDDIGAILVVAFYYTDGIQFGWLAAAIVVLAMMPLLRRLGVGHPAPYIALGLIAWFATFESGVHATIAGVAIGLLTPVHGRDGAVEGSPLDRLEEALHPWSSFVVLPLFALANAGIPLDAESIDAARETPVALAVVLGLVVGKTLGLTAGVGLAVRLGVSRLPPGTSWAHVVGVGALAGIGFTVSLFITGLAFADPGLVAASKIGVLAGSTTAAVLGVALLLLASRRAAATRAAPRPGP